MAQAVKDPSLDLAYAAPARPRLGRPTRGWPVALPGARRGPLASRSSPTTTARVAALIHDATLREQRAFVEAVGAYALVWDENERLAERVDSSRGELRASRARILAAADDERRRIERDLHDGGQQRLVALRIRLQLAEDMMARSPAGARELLQRLAQDVDGVLEELRSLAAGRLPGDARRARARPTRCAPRRCSRRCPVTRRDQGRRARYPEDVETAAYFCVPGGAPERGQARAGGDGRLQVLLELDDDLVFEVRDDGPGFDMKERSQPRAAEHARPRRGARRRA